MNLREQWRGFVTDPSRAGRHLTNLGKAVAPADGSPIDPAVLADFLKKLSGGDASLELIAGIVDLAAGDYGEFCKRQLPALLDSLANEKVGELAVVGPVLRGSTRWDLTTIGQLSGRLRPAQFVTRLPQRSFALPENALVRWLVEDLTRTISWVEGRVGSKGLLPQLAHIRAGCDEALRHPWIGEVPPPRWLDPAMRLAAERQRLPAYRHAAKLAARRQRFLSRDRASRWRHMLDLLAVNWLAPLSDDDLFELFALVLVLDVLEQDLGLGSPTQYGLAAPGRDHVALFEAGGGSVRVFFDQSPVSTLGYDSYQLRILAAHDGARGTARRPDLTVVHDRAEVRRLTLVEVKRTAESGYISDSVYKALGYLSDFRAIWEQSPGNPKIVVLFPETIAPKPSVAMDAQEVVLISGSDRANFARALAAGLGV